MTTKKTKRRRSSSEVSRNNADNVVSLHELDNEIMRQLGYELDAMVDDFFRYATERYLEYTVRELEAGMAYRETTGVAVDAIARYNVTFIRNWRYAKQWFDVSNAATTEMR